MFLAVGRGSETSGTLACPAPTPGRAGAISVRRGPEVRSAALTVFAVIAACAAIGAQPAQLGAPVTANRPGDYVIYHDTRTEPDAYLGILYLGEPNYYLRRYEPESGQSTEVAVGLLPDTELDSTPVKVIDVGPGPEAVRAVVVDFLRLAAQRGRVDERGFPEEIQLEEPALEGQAHSLASTYKFWVPIFQLFQCSWGDDPSRGLGVVSAGHALRLDDPAFFAYAGPGRLSEGPHLHLVAAEPDPVSVDGLRLSLDANWYPYNGCLFQIHESTQQDAVLVVETLDLEEVGVPSIYSLMKYTLLMKDPEIELLGDRTRVYQRGQTPVLEFTVVDRRSHVLTRQLTRFISRGDRVFSMETLAALDTVYQDNRAYFDGILFGSDTD
jgi:hypothetical protein